MTATAAAAIAPTATAVTTTSHTVGVTTYSVDHPFFAIQIIMGGSPVPLASEPHGNASHGDPCDQCNRLHACHASILRFDRLGRRSDVFAYCVCIALAEAARGNLGTTTVVTPAKAGVETQSGGSGPAYSTVASNGDTRMIARKQHGGRWAEAGRHAGTPTKVVRLPVPVDIAWLSLHGRGLIGAAIGI
jgi:hypothetical protein